MMKHCVSCWVIYPSPSRLNSVINWCLSFDLRVMLRGSHFRTYPRPFCIYHISPWLKRQRAPTPPSPIRRCLCFSCILRWEPARFPEDVPEEGWLSFLAVLPCKPKGPPPYSSGVIMCWPPPVVNPELMYAHQAGITEEREPAWHPGQLGVSEARRRERENNMRACKEWALMRLHSYRRPQCYYCVIRTNTSLDRDVTVIYYFI